MKVISQSAKILFDESPLKHIEKIGRLCYKSEDKIADGTDRAFVKRLFDSGHMAMLEHYRFIMKVSPGVYNDLAMIAPRHIEFSCYDDRCLISMNARTLVELAGKNRSVQFGILPMAIENMCNSFIDSIIIRYDCPELFGKDCNYKPNMPDICVEFINNSLEDMTYDEWKIHGWYSVDMITDRGITHEIVRHREETSFAQESTRYCNYSKNKFDNEITVIDQGLYGNDKNVWMELIYDAEKAYMQLINNGITPQIARAVLPTCLKSEIVMTAPVFEWEHFFNLRLLGKSGNPHPMIKELAGMVFNEMREAIK